MGCLELWRDEDVRRLSKVRWILTRTSVAGGYWKTRIDMGADRLVMEVEDDRRWKRGRITPNDVLRVLSYGFDGVRDPVLHEEVALVLALAARNAPWFVRHRGDGALLLVQASPAVAA